MGGFLFDYLGFRKTTLVFQCIGVAMLLVDLVRLCRMRRNRKVVLRKVRTDKIDLYEKL